MARLLVHVEGQTEEDFVNQILSSYLGNHGFFSVTSRRLGNARQASNRGGIKNWPSVKKEIANHLKQDGDWIITTMVDYYALPQGQPNGWPGRSDSQSAPHTQKAPSVETALFNELRLELQGNLSKNRFIPFVVMHEFEALLFSDCATFSQAIKRPDLEGQFSNIRSKFGTPEEINDSPLTAPSKRITQIFPAYAKRFHGPLAASEIGLDRIREQCPHFNNWINRLLNCLR
jgi:hypothetical protein